MNDTVHNIPVEALWEGSTTDHLLVAFEDSGLTKDAEMPHKFTIGGNPDIFRYWSCERDELCPDEVLSWSYANKDLTRTLTIWSK